jgi:hypothetical protein
MRVIFKPMNDSYIESAAMKALLRDSLCPKLPTYIIMIIIIINY